MGKLVTCLTFLICLNVNQAFKLDNNGVMNKESTLSTMNNRLTGYNRIRHGKNRFSRCLRFFQLSKTFNFNHCREIQDIAAAIIQPEIVTPNEMMIQTGRGGKIKRFQTWTKYHSF